MKRIIGFTVLTILALTLAACGASGGAPQASSPGGSSFGNAGGSGSSSFGQNNGQQSGGPSALQLAAGMIKLDGTSYAVTPQEAAKLLPLWKSLQQTESTAVPQGGTPQARGTGTPGPRFNSAEMQQIGAQISSIENAMTPDQIQAITAMNLNRQDIFTIFQQAGITMGGPGQGGNFRPNGGTFTPPQGTPPAEGTPGAFQRGSGNFSGRSGFGSFIPRSVVDGIVQFLQKKAAS